MALRGIAPRAVAEHVERLSNVVMVRSSARHPLLSGGSLLDECRSHQLADLAVEHILNLRLLVCISVLVLAWGRLGLVLRNLGHTLRQLHGQGWRLRDELLVNSGCARACLGVITFRVQLGCRRGLTDPARMLNESTVLVRPGACFVCLDAVADAARALVDRTGHTTLPAQLHHPLRAGDARGFQPFTLLGLVPVRLNVVLSGRIFEEWLGGFLSEVPAWLLVDGQRWDPVGDVVFALFGVILVSVGHSVANDAIIRVVQLLLVSEAEADDLARRGHD